MTLNKIIQKSIIVFCFFCLSPNTSVFSTPGLPQDNAMMMPADMGEELKKLMSSEEGKAEMLEQFKFIAQMAGESDPDSFARKMMNETQDLVSDQGKLNEFNQVATSMQQQMIEGAQAEGKKAQNPTFDKRIASEESFKQKGDETKTEPPKDLAKSKASKPLDSKALTWQEGVIRNIDDQSKEDEAYMKTFKKYFSSGVAELISKANAVEDAMSEIPKAQEEQIKNDFLQTLQKEVIKDLAKINRSYLMPTLFQEKHNAIRLKVVEIVALLQDLVNELKDLDDEDIPELETPKRIKSSDITAETDLSFLTTRKGVVGINPEIEALKLATDEILKILQDKTPQGIQKDVEDAVNKKKNLIASAEALAKYNSFDPSMYDRYMDNLGQYNPYGGGGGYPGYYGGGDYGQSRYWPDSYNPYGGYGNYGDYGYGPNSPYNDSMSNRGQESPREENASTYDKQKSKNPVDDFLKDKDVQLIISVGKLNNYGEEKYYEQVSDTFLKVNTEKVQKKLSGITQKVRKKKKKKAKESTEKSEKSETVELNEEQTKKLQQISGQMLAGLVTLYNHPTIQQVAKGAQASQSMFITLPSLDKFKKKDVGQRKKELLENIDGTKIENTSEVIELLTPYIQSIQTYNDEITTKQKSFLGLLGEVEKILSSESDNKTPAYEKIEEERVASITKGREKFAKNKALKDLESLLIVLESNAKKIQQLLNQLNQKSLEDQELVRITNNLEHEFSALVKNMQALTTKSVLFAYSLPGWQSPPKELSTRIKNLLHGISKSTGEILSNVLQGDEAEEKIEKGVLNRLLAELVELFEKLGLKISDEEHFKLNRMKFVALSKALYQIWAIPSQVTETINDWGDFLTLAALDPAEMFKMYQASSELLTPEQRADLWSNTKAEIKSKLPDYLAEWCKGGKIRKDRLSTTEPEVVKKQINSKLKSNTQLAQKVIDQLNLFQKVKRAALLDIHQSQDVVSGYHYDSIVRELIHLVTAAALNHFENEPPGFMQENYFKFNRISQNLRSIEQTKLEPIQSFEILAEEILLSIHFTLWYDPHPVKTPPKDDYIINKLKLCALLFANGLDHIFKVMRIADSGSLNQISLKLDPKVKIADGLELQVADQNLIAKNNDLLISEKIENSKHGIFNQLRFLLARETVLANLQTKGKTDHEGKELVTTETITFETLQKYEFPKASNFKPYIQKAKYESEEHLNDHIMVTHKALFNVFFPVTGGMSLAWNRDLRNFGNPLITGTEPKQDDQQALAPPTNPLFISLVNHEAMKSLVQRNINLLKALWHLSGIELISQDLKLNENLKLEETLQENISSLKTVLLKKNDTTAKTDNNDNDQLDKQSNTKKAIEDGFKEIEKLVPKVQIANQTTAKAQTT